MNTTTDIFFFSPGQEVAWTVAIPGLDISVEMVAVVLTSDDDHNLGEILTILPWGQKLAWLAWSNASVSEPHAVAMEELRLTGRTFTTEELRGIVAHADASY